MATDAEIRIVLRNLLTLSPAAAPPSREALVAAVAEQTDAEPAQIEAVLDAEAGEPPR